MALSLGDCEVLQQSRGEAKRGKAFKGVRVFAIPNGSVESLRSDFEPSTSNRWPGQASTWLVTTDYVIDDEVIGDGSPNSYHYKCILANGPGGVGAKEPPNSTYWTRIRSSACITECRIEKEFPGRKGYSRVTSWYEKPTRRRVLRDNQGKGLIEVTVGHSMVKQKRETDGTSGSPSIWAAGTDYVVGNVVRGDGNPDALDYICILANGPGGVGAKQPPDATYWSPFRRVIEGPVDPELWENDRDYAVGALVRGDGDPDSLPYICILAHTIGVEGAQQPPNATYWELYNGKYQVVQGSNMWPKSTCTIKIVSATDDIDLSTELALLGKYNSVQLTNIGNVAANTLLYMGYHSVRVTQEDDISDQTRVFWYNPSGWNDTCQVQRFRKIVVQSQVKDAAGSAVSGAFARVTGWYTDTAAAETRNVTLGPADFSAFNNMVDWDT